MPGVVIARGSRGVIGGHWGLPFHAGVVIARGSRGVVVIQLLAIIVWSVIHAHLDK